MGVVIDKRSRFLWAESAGVRLSVRELQVLQQLDMVRWTEAEAQSDPENFRNYIKRLRGKGIQIENQYGLGYRLKEPVEILETEE